MCNDDRALKDRGTRMRRDFKDLFFRFYFGIKENLLYLYNTLYPDGEKVTLDQIRNITLDPDMYKGPINDLGIDVNGHLIVLVEAQSSWPKDAFLRFLGYLSKEIALQNADKDSLNDRTDFPKVGLFMIYNRPRGNRPSILRLSDIVRDSDIEMIVHVAYGENEKEGPIYDYVTFIGILEEQMDTYGYTSEAVRVAMSVARERKIMVDFLDRYGERLMDAIEDMLFNPERNERQHEYQLREEGREEGIEIGREEGIGIGREETKLEVAKNLLAKKMPVDFVAETTGLDIETVRKIQSEL